MSTLSIGKIRGLQQISSDRGIFIMCAMDHRSGLISMMEDVRHDMPDYHELVQTKIDMCATLGSYCTGVLLDPEYGAAQCIASSALRGSTGLLVSIEASGYEKDPRGRLTLLLKDWGVEKIKRMGASAVKMLVYYRPDIKELASKQLKTIEKVANKCIKYDIPFLVEPKTYRREDENIDSAEFAYRLPELVIETARQITELPIDVLKCEFPVDMRYEKNEAKMAEYCRELDIVSKVPWVLLSAGVDYDMFKKQVFIACHAGASGFLGGRAIWQEGLNISERDKRIQFFKDTAAKRLQELSNIAGRSARPWYEKLGLPASTLIMTGPDWYHNY